MGNKLLILSGNEETLSALSGMCSEYIAKLGISSISVSDSAENVRDKFSADKECEYSMVIISTPLSDEYGLSIVNHISENSDVAILLSVSQKNAESVFSKICDTGAIILPKPINKASLFQTMSYMNAERKRRIEAKAKYSELDRKLHETKIVDRAKCVLIEYLSISESEAHRQIQKRAMDMREPLIEVAADILKTYEYL